MSAINAADRSGYVKRTPDETLVASVLAEFHMVSSYFILMISKEELSLQFFDYRCSSLLSPLKYHQLINIQRINKSYMSIIKRSVSNLAHSLSEGTPLFKSKIELCVPQIVLTPSLADMQVTIALIHC